MFDNEDYEVVSATNGRNDDDRSTSSSTDMHCASGSPSVTSPAANRDPDYTEERYRVDRRKLEQMIQAGDRDNAEQFFSKIMTELNVHIAWPSRLKIGAKSKKDPHIKVSGHRDAVLLAKTRIMDVLDTRMMRVTLKMDVCHTEHSHIIGKAGCNIKNVMHETGCHIHFPDSNRTSTNTGEKSNQVSIAGLGSSVEKARAMIRDLAPLLLMFEVPSALSRSHVSPLPLSSAIHAVQQHYSVSVTIRSEQKATNAAAAGAGCPADYGTRQTVVVRGSMNSVKAVTEASAALYEILTAQSSVSFPVCLSTDIAAQHHQQLTGPAGISVKQIMQATGTTICFPDPVHVHPHRQHTVQISGTIPNVLMARQQLLGSLPLVLMFDVKEDCVLNQGIIARLAEELDIYINIKMKPKQTAKTVIMKSQECCAVSLYEARQRLLAFACDPPVVGATPSNLPSLRSPAVGGLGSTSAICSPVRDCSGLRANGKPDLFLPTPPLCMMASTNAVLMYDQPTALRCPVNPMMYSVVSGQSPSPLTSAVMPAPVTSQGVGYPNVYPNMYPYPQIPQCSVPTAHVDSSAMFNPTTNTRSAFHPVNGVNANSAFGTNPVVNGLKGSELANPPNTANQLQQQQTPSVSSPGNIWSNTVSSLTEAMSNLTCLPPPTSSGGSSSSTPVNGYLSLQNCEPGVPVNNLRVLSDCAPKIDRSRHCSLLMDSEPHNLLNDPREIGSLRGGKERPETACERQDMLDLLSSTSADGTSMLSDETAALLVYIDYERKKQLASQAMMKKPDGESRTPTHLWAGLGFSKSMPDSEIRSRLSSSLVCQDPRMTTTYETNEEEYSKQENEEVNSIDAEYSSPQEASWSSLPPVSLPAAMPEPQRADSAPCCDLMDLLNSLSLKKYIDIFVQQEIDLATFLTLTDDDLKELGIAAFGARRKMLLAIADISKQAKKITSSKSVIQPPPGLPNPFKDRPQSQEVYPGRQSFASQSGRW